MKKPYMLSVVIGLLIVGTQTVTLGSQFLIDFNEVSADPNDGLNWNVIANPFGQYSISDSTGVGTIHMDIYDSFADSGLTGNGYVPTGDASWAGNAGLDYFWISSSNPTGGIKFSGLGSGAKFSVSIYSGNYSFPDNTDWKIDGEFSDNGNSDNFNPLNNQSEIMLWENRTAQNGEFSITVDEWKGVGTTPLNAIKIDVIPEPASIGLIGLVSGGIFFVRRFFIT